jgi:hypothetical protein
MVADLKVAAMGLVNALVCAGPGRQHVEFRQHIRYEFFVLGLDSIMDRLKLVAIIKLFFSIIYLYSSFMFILSK